MESRLWMSTAPSDCGFRTTHTATTFGHGFRISVGFLCQRCHRSCRHAGNRIWSVFSEVFSIKVAWLQEAPVVVSAGSHGPGGPVGNGWVKNHIVFEKKSWNTPRSPYKSMSLEKKTQKKSNFDFKVVVVFVCQSRKEVARLAGCRGAWHVRQVTFSLESDSQCGAILGPQKSWPSLPNGKKLRIRMEAANVVCKFKKKYLHWVLSLIVCHPLNKSKLFHLIVCQVSPPPPLAMPPYSPHFLELLLPRVDSMHRFEKCDSKWSTPSILTPQT